MGKYIGSTATIQPTQASAGGVYTLKDQLVYNAREQWPVGRDPYFNYTTLLLQGDVPYTRGRNAMTTPLAYNSDASANNFLITPNGDVGPRPFSPYFGGNYSVYFDGSGTLLRTTASALSSSAFTVEGWVYLAGASNQTYAFFDFANAINLYGMMLLHTSSGNLEFSLRSTSSSTPVIGTITSSFAGLYNKWVHIAVTYDGSVYRMFVDGQSVGTPVSSATQVVALNVLTVGARSDSSPTQVWLGYISNFRYVTGAALYTSNFTPSLAPLSIAASGTARLLICQSNRFIDNSSSPYTLTVTGSPRITDNSPFVSPDFTTGAGYFDGNGDYFGNIGTTSSFNFMHSGGPLFTFQCWVYPTSMPGSGEERAIFTTIDGTANVGISLRLAPNNSTSSYFSCYIARGSAGTYIFSSASSGTVPLNAWSHIALVYDQSLASNNGIFYINGVQSGTGNKTGSSVASSDASYSGRIGAYQVSESITYNFRGFISDLKISNTADSIVLPTKPLLPDSNTKLLTLQTRAPSQNINFIDSSPNELLVTKSNTVTQGTFSPYTSSWSNYFNGSSGITLPNNANYGVAANTDFCWEAFIYMPSLPASAGHYSIWNNRNAPVSACGWQFGFANVSGTYAIVGTLTSGSTDTNVSINLINQSLVTANQWHHIALARNNGVIYGYWNGVLQGTLNYTASINAGAGVSGIGWRPNGYNDLYFNGYISNFRFVNGSAVYPGGATFTVPTTALAPIANTVLLTAASNRFIDLSTQNATISLQSSPSVQPFSPHAPTSAISSQVTGGSGYFSSGSLTIPHSPVLNLNSVDFCIEAWVYLISAPLTIAQKYVGGNVGSSEYYFAIDGTNQLSIAVDGGGGEDYFRTSANTVRPNAWNHCVVTRVGNDFKLFINGVLQNYSTSSRTLNATSTGFTSGGGSGNYISSVRITKGTIPDQYKTVATTTGIQVFTPPTGPLASIPGTQLLLNFTNGAAVDATGRNVLESVGNVHTTRAQAKFDPLIGGSAIYFDGTSDWLASSNGNMFITGTENFTVEGWLYLNSIAGTQAIISGTTNNSFFLRYGRGYNLTQGLNIGRQFVADAEYCAFTFATGQWYHIAVCRSNGTIYFFVNGQQQTTQGSGVSSYSFATTPNYVVGTSNVTNGAEPINGYLNDLRVTRGVARYTTNFNTNLPAAPFPRG